ncbi:MAG: methyltransferase domain-containing protein, partial [Chloroflexota bacterium]
TGCGAIAVSLALELTGVTVFAVDISAEALRFAGINCRRHGTLDRVLLLQGDMLSALPAPADIILANLPYVRVADLAVAGALGEPLLALDGGTDGLDGIRRLCAKLPGRLQAGGHLVLEVGAGQAGTVRDMLRELFPRGVIRQLTDLGGIERVICLDL